MITEGIVSGQMVRTQILKIHVPELEPQRRTKRRRNCTSLRTRIMCTCSGHNIVNKKIHNNLTLQIRKTC